jgi:hypothetical protein
MAGSLAESDETIFTALLGGPRRPRGPASVRSHDARNQRQDSVLRRQFPKNPDETQCDMALASPPPASLAAAGTHARRRTTDLKTLAQIVQITPVIWR